MATHRSRSGVASMSNQDLFLTGIVVLLGMILWEIGQFRKDYRFINKITPPRDQ